MNKRIAASVFAVMLVLLSSYILFEPRGSADGDLATFRLIDFFSFQEKVDVGRMAHQMRVAVVSTQSLEEKEENLIQIRELSERIMTDHRDTSLIVFGESSLGLYFDTANPIEYQRGIAVRIPGEATDEISRISDNLDVHIACGVVEEDQGALYNSLVVVDPEGEIIAKHRKMLLHYLDELSGITQASPNAQVFEIGEFRFGLAICADANSKWLINTYREEEIDVLLYSVTSKIPSISVFLRYWPFSKRYDAWILAANRYGVEGEDEYPGTVFIAAPTGAIQNVKKDDGPGYITGVIGKN